MTVVEGNSGTKNLTFVVRLSAASGRQVTVNYATADDTATAGSDYTAKSGTLTFLAGWTSQNVTVVISGDEAVEADEQFWLNLDERDERGPGRFSGDWPHLERRSGRGLRRRIRRLVGSRDAGRRHKPR